MDRGSPGSSGAGSGPDRADLEGPEVALSRRKIFARAAGVAAVGAAAGSVL